MGTLLERDLTLLAASRACSMSSFIFLMFSVMLFIWENCDVKFSTSEILSFRVGMFFNKFLTVNRSGRNNLVIKSLYRRTTKMLK